VKAATNALAAASLPDQAVVLASWGLVGGLGMLGRAISWAQWPSAVTPRPPGASMLPCLRLGLYYRHMLGLRLAGYLHEPTNSRCRHAVSRGRAGLVSLGGIVLLGHADLARGHLDSSLRWLMEARRGLQAFGDVGAGCFVAFWGLRRPWR